MANQYTMKKYNINEINEIILLYQNGMSFSEISLKFNRKKDKIKQILIENNVWIENRDLTKKEFTTEEESEILRLYCNEKLSLNDVGKNFGVSKTVIKRILINKNLLRKGLSNGQKIILTNEQKNIIEKLYIIEYKSSVEIAIKMGLTASFISKYLSSTNYRRDKGSATSIGLVKRYGGLNYDDYLDKLPEYLKYRKKVLSVTNKQLISNLENYNKRGTYKDSNAYHLDHKYSILEGFKNDIDPNIIGNINNLEFIPWKENLKKRSKCSITITQLINKI